MIELICERCGFSSFGIERIDRKNKSFYFCLNCKDYTQKIEKKSERIKIKGKDVEIEREKGKIKKIDWIGRGKGK